MGYGISRWRQLPVCANAFEEPSHSKTLCVVVGYGVQVAGLASVVILSSALGIMSMPISKGILVTLMIAAYLLSATASGYVGVWLWRVMTKGDSEGWNIVSSSTCFLSVIGFVVLTVLKVIDNLNNNSNPSATSLPLNHFLFLLLWLCISVALTRVGGFMAARSDGPIKLPMIKDADENLQEIPRRLWTWFMVLVAGIVPLGFILIELYIVVVSSWLDSFSRSFVPLAIPALLLAISCAAVSVGVTYRCIATEDWMWWWKAFFASGSAGFYVFICSVRYLVVDLNRQNEVAFAVVYIGYSMLLSIAIMLFTGAVGFLSAFGFLRYLAFSQNSKPELWLYVEL